MVALRRLIAEETSAVDFYDATMAHIQVFVNYSLRLEGVEQVHFVA